MWLKCIKNYVNFNGRARRKEYWMFTLINTIIMTVLTTVDLIEENSIEGSRNMFELYANVSSGAGVIKFVEILMSIYSLFILLPSLAVTVRRLHDIGKSGPYIFMGLIPLAGPIILLVYACKEGNIGPNMYGPDPKAAERMGNPYQQPQYGQPQQPQYQQPQQPQYQQSQQPQYQQPQQSQYQQPQQPQAAAVNKCPNCGTDIPAGNSFCPNCGTKIN